MKAHRWSIWLLRLVIGGVYLAAGALKLVDPRAFQDDIVAFALVGERPSAMLAAWLPAWEIVVGVCALIPSWSRAAVIAILMTTSGFILIIAAALWRGLDIPCACLGPWSHDLRTALGVDLILLAAAIWHLRRTRTVEGGLPPC